MCLTPYPEVDQVIERLNREVQAILGDQLVGIYLHGSLASGDFDPTSSDVDFLVLTGDQVDEKTVATLGKMHARLRNSGSKWGRKLEGSYLPLGHLREKNLPKPPRPYVNQDQFYLAPHGDEWLLEKYVLREMGLVVVGPPISDLIEPISPEEVRRAAVDILHNWWVPMLADDTRLESAEYQAYGILSMCRIMYTVQHGGIVSKRVAAEWVQQEFPDLWTQVIEQALSWQDGVELDLVEETRQMISFTREYCGEYLRGVREKL